METFLIRALQLILSLSILVFLHEFGHFFFARLFKVRVEKFYLFFNPTFSLIRAKKVQGRWQVRFFARNVPANERPKVNSDGMPLVDSKGKPLMESIPLSELSDNDWRKYPENTEWGLGWLPLGGYCKIAGMIDESMDKTQMALPPQTWEYRSRPVWQRLPIIVGGVLVNFLLALVIYVAVLFTWGKEYLPMENARFGYQFSETLLQNGFQNGDQILFVEGQTVEQRADFIQKILIEGKQEVTVLRDTQTIQVQLPENFDQQVLAARERELIAPRYPFVIDSVEAGSPAHYAKLSKGDSIISINGISTPAFHDVVSKLPTLVNQEIVVGFVRHGEVKTATILLGEEPRIGVVVKQPMQFLETKNIQFSFFEAIPAGISLGWETLTNYVKQFRLVFTKEGSQQLGGFGSIGSMFPKIWDWQIFWTMTAFLSVILAFMNFLPIPALDGGHVMFLLYEMITGKKPGEKFMERAQTAGMFFLLLLLIYANGNDIIRAIFN